MKKAAKKSWDTIATRNVYVALTDQDTAKLSRALGEGGNPNDQKRINRWSAPLTPMLKAVGSGFVPAIPILAKAGARRRTTGSQALSAFGFAVANRQAGSFDMLCKTFGPMTALEVLDCCVAIRSFRGKDMQAQEQWVDRVVEAVERYPVKISPTVAAGIAMQFLGGESLPDPTFPHLARKFMDAGIITPALISRARDAEGMGSWGQVLSNRTRSPDRPDEALSVELLHALKFPFDAAVEAAHDQVERWLVEQAARTTAERLDASTPSTDPQPSPTAHRPRL